MELQPTGRLLPIFDYKAVPEQYRSEVQIKTAELKMLTKQTAQGIIEIGHRLIEIKDKLGHGNWLPWLDTEFGWSDQTARNMIRVADKFKTVLNLEGISTRALYMLAAPSTPDEVKADVVEIAKAGEAVDHKTVKELRDAKEEITRLQANIRRLQNELDLVLEQPDDPEPIEPPDTSAFENKIVSLEGELSKKQQTIAQYKDKIRDLTVKYELLQKKAVKAQPKPTTKYTTIVIDPPWPIQKIAREERPHQAEFDYPTMSIEEIMALPVESISADECHLYLWTTQKYLPDAINIARVWGFKYQCLLTWVKNVGFTPFSWMYSTEHVVFATRGGLKTVKQGIRLDFSAKVREHSRKPDEFYDIAKEMSPAPRIDYFSREKRDGFEQYGNEVTRFG